MVKSSFKILKYEYNDDQIKKMDCVMRYGNRKDKVIMSLKDKAWVKNELKDYKMNGRHTGYPAFICINEAGEYFVNGCKSYNTDIKLPSGSNISVKNTSMIDTYFLWADNEGDQICRSYSSAPLWEPSKITENLLTYYEDMDSLIYVIYSPNYDFKYRYDISIYFGSQLKYIFYSVSRLELYSPTDFVVWPYDDMLNLYKYRFVDGTWFDLLEEG